MCLSISFAFALESDLHTHLPDLHVHLLDLHVHLLDLHVHLLDLHVQRAGLGLTCMSPQAQPLLGVWPRDHNTRQGSGLLQE